jgi:hypothetical protein
MFNVEHISPFFVPARYEHDGYTILSHPRDETGSILPGNSELWIQFQRVIIGGEGIF